MKKAKKSKVNKEPTISDVMGAVQTLSGTVQNLSGKFDNLEGTVQKLSGKFDNLSGTVQKQGNKIDGLSSRFDNLEGTVNKLTGKVGNLEGNIQDLTEAVQTGFAKVEVVLDRHDGLLKTLVVGQDGLRESIHILDQRVGKTQNRIEDVVDENQDSLLKYGRRITVLEKARA